MSATKHKPYSLIAILAILTLILAACGAQPVAAPTALPAVTQPTEATDALPATQAPAVATDPPTESATEAPATAEATEAAATPEGTEAATATTGTTAPGSGGTATREETVIFDIDGGRVTDPELWNFLVPGSRTDHGFHQSMIEPLFILNYEDGETIPWLGESMTSNESLDVWTLKLRQGVKWSDGEAFNADDVVFTLNLLLENAPELSNSASMKEWVKNVEKVDDLTVTFNLNKPNPRFQLDYFSVRIYGGVNILPEHIWKGQDPLTFKNYDTAKGWPVFTGPYKLQSVSPTEFVYTRDDNWWGAAAGFKPLPKPKQLIWTWAGPEETRAALMADNGLDSLMDVTLGAFQALKSRNDKSISYYDEAPFAWVPDPCSRTFELNNAVEPWNDPEMRWALNYAINRDQIVQIAYEGTTIPSRHFFPAYPPMNRFVELLEEKGLYEKYPITLHDPDKARQIIESKGWTKVGDYYEKDGKQLAVDIQTHEAFIEKQRIAQVLVEQFQAIGVNATTRNLAGGTWDENFRTGNYDVRMGWQSCGSVNEPWNSLDRFNISWYKPVGEAADGDQWRWQNEEYSKLVDQIGVLPLGDPQIDELFVQAMEIWMAELPIIPITQAKKIIPFNNTYWTNWPSSSNNYIHPPTWWQSTHVIIHSLQPAGGQ